MLYNRRNNMPIKGKKIFIDQVKKKAKEKKRKKLQTKRSGEKT